MAMWGGRFQEASLDEFRAFNDSLRFDYLLSAARYRRIAQLGLLVWLKLALSLQQKRRYWTAPWQNWRLKLQPTRSCRCKPRKKISIAG